MALYIPHSIFHFAWLLYVRPETFGPYYVCRSNLFVVNKLRRSTVPLFGTGPVELGTWVEINLLWGGFKRCSEVRIPLVCRFKRNDGVAAHCSTHTCRSMPVHVPSYLPQYAGTCALIRDAVCRYMCPRTWCSMPVHVPSYVMQYAGTCALICALSFKWRSAKIFVCSSKYSRCW